MTDFRFKHGSCEISPLAKTFQPEGAVKERFASCIVVRSLLGFCFIMFPLPCLLPCNKNRIVRSAYVEVAGATGAT